MTIINIVTILLGLVGLAFMGISFFGICKFPDFFTRLHVQGVGDTIGALLILIAMVVATGLKLLSIKILLLFLVIMLTNPIGTNMIMIAAIHNRDYQGYKDKDVKDVEEETEEGN